MLMFKWPIQGLCWILTMGNWVPWRVKIKENYPEHIHLVTARLPLFLDQKKCYKLYEQLVGKKGENILNGWGDYTVDELCSSSINWYTRAMLQNFHNSKEDHWHILASGGGAKIFLTGLDFKESPLFLDADEFKDKIIEAVKRLEQSSSLADRFRLEFKDDFGNSHECGDCGADHNFSQLKIDYGDGEASCRNCATTMFWFDLPDPSDDDDDDFEFSEVG